MSQSANGPLDADRIIELIHENLNRNGEGNESSLSTKRVNTPFDRAWNKLMKTWFMGDDRPFHSHRPVLGKMIVGTKKLLKPVVKAPLSGKFQAQRELNAQFIEVLKQFKQQLDENQKIAGEWVTRDQLRGLLDTLVHYHEETLKTVQAVETRINDLQYRLENDLAAMDRKRIWLEAQIAELKNKMDVSSREGKL